MFDFLEEFAAIFDYLSSKKDFKCAKCGFLIQKSKRTEMKDSINCPKCGQDSWIETDAMEGGNI